MKSKVFILCFTILLIFGQIVFGQEKGVGNKTVSKLPAKEKRWALIIGVSQYEDGNITPLPGANNDAKALRDALRDYAGFDERQIILLTTDETKDRQPTKNNILRYLGNLQGTVPKDGLLLVAFSGHGIERQNQAFLLASDTPYNDNVKVLERTALSVSNDLNELIRDTGVGQVVILLDACRNDPSSGRASSDNLLTQAYTEGFNFNVRNKEVEAFVTIYATSIGERAYEYTRENKGYFTWAFIEGLKGGAANENGEVTLGGLVRYVERYVPQQVKIDLGGNKLQRPFSIVEGYKADELVLAIAKKPNLITNTFPESTKPVPQPASSGASQSPGRLSDIFLKPLPKTICISGLEVFKGKNGKYGYKNWLMGKTVILPKFNEASSFSIYEGFYCGYRGLAAVKLGNKWGYINETGKMVIAYQYSEASAFSNGKARVKLRGRYFEIDENGNEIK